MSSTQTETKTFEFKAEVKQLLNILVHSLYTSREIFLRELISNASDALDKLRFKSTKGDEILDNDLPLEIKIDFDEKKNTLTISDTGIGMTQDEIVENIGTIAKSGSAEFIKTLMESKDQANNIIGKFGVGFYSVFMVAEEVEIKSRSYRKDAKPIYWKSDGLGSYTVQELDGNLKRGTEIKIKLREDAKEFTEKYRLESTIKRHSNFITFPIFIGKDKVNTISAIWREPKSSVKKEQYDEFYKFLTYDSEPPMDIIHKSVDAPIQFNALLFIPSKHNEFFWMHKDDYGLDLYVKRVLIQHKNKDLLPEYLGFVKGVVDSEDLPLNISRETLQENIVFSKISSSVTLQVLNYLADKAKNNPDEYAKFWKEHGRIFKLGYSDYSNQEKYMDLLRFNSSSIENKDGLTSFAEYSSRMKEDQKTIYYAAGSSRDSIELDPHLEIFRSKGIEVLYLLDPVDEFVINSLHKYKDFEIESVENADLKKIEKLESVEEKKTDFEKLEKDDEKHFSSLLSKMKEVLGDRVVDVRESKRLSGSASCLASEGDAMTASMQKILKMTNPGMADQKKILEINRDNKLIRNLLEVFKKDSNDSLITNATEQLFESALLLEGNLNDPHKLVKRINELLEKSSDWYLGKK
ncbi:MAG: molecular chaperone HtpG [Melioribacteraceae bacterium]|nr:molecular chaperone HtpG [Melioribacteraceae bacterium]WKZ70815.1 MAG: molecular chaperone HtpG [Melioribacteraceae bacterium]